MDLDSRIRSLEPVLFLAAKRCQFLRSQAPAKKRAKTNVSAPRTRKMELLRSGAGVGGTGALVRMRADAAEVERRSRIERTGKMRVALTPALSHRMGEGELIAARGAEVGVWLAVPGVMSRWEEELRGVALTP